MARIAACRAGFCLWLCLFLPAAAAAQESEAADKTQSPWQFEGKASFLTDYVFRGLNVYNDTSIQPYLRLGHDFGAIGTLSGAVWSHFSAGGPKRHDRNFTEIDYTAAYSITLEPISVSAGHIWYVFPHDNTGMMPDTAEIFAACTVSLPGSPTFTFYSDYDKFDYRTYELSFSHFFGDAEGFNITPGIVFGFASDSEKIYERDGLEHITLSFSFDAKLGMLTASPVLNYTFKIDDYTSDELVGGFSVRF